MIPGEIIVSSPDIELNEGQMTQALVVENAGDRPIQVGSHYHFYECNSALVFDRKKAYGCRLAIASGTAIRFEPGQRREVELIAFRGRRHVFGFVGAIMGPLEDV